MIMAKLKCLPVPWPSEDKIQSKHATYRYPSLSVS